jgi:signal peptidase II
VVIKGLFDINYVTNDGAAFGLFRGWNPIFIMVTFIAIVFIFVYHRQFKDDLWMRIALGFLLGGAVGNLIDRIRINQVIDFINFRWWPSFNVADISVCIGAGMLLVKLIRGEGKPTKTVCLIAFILFVAASVSVAFGQEEESKPQSPKKTEGYEYTESPLRRFEIIFTVSLPFTTLHSYAVVRGIKMAQERKVSPKFSKSDWRNVGLGAVGFSAFIGFWDWLHTHKHNPSQPRISKTSRGGSRTAPIFGDRESKVDFEFDALAKLELVRFEF